MQIHRLLWRGGAPEPKDNSNTNRDDRSREIVCEALSTPTVAGTLEIPRKRLIREHSYRTFTIFWHLWNPSFCQGQTSNTHTALIRLPTCLPQPNADVIGERSPTSYLLLLSFMALTTATTGYVFAHGALVTHCTASLCGAARGNTLKLNIPPRCY